MRKKLTALCGAILLMGNVLSVCAQEQAAVTFTDGNQLEYTGVDFYEDGTPKLGSSFEGIAPGETASQTITMHNENSRTVDFYMNAGAIQALEQSAEKARGAGYEIRLTSGDTVLYDSTVGGYAGEGADGSAEGILEMNDGALDGYVFVGTLAQGESREIALSIFFDGEAMDNESQAVDYSNTFGQLGFSFRVAYEDPAGPTVIYQEVTRKGQTSYVKELVELIEEKIPLASVATGDNALIGLGAAVLVLGLVLVILTGRRNKEEKKA